MFAYDFPLLTMFWVGDGICVGRDSSSPVTPDYADRSTFAFTGGTIDHEGQVRLAPHRLTRRRETFERDPIVCPIVDSNLRSHSEGGHEGRLDLRAGRSRTRHHVRARCRTQPARGGATGTWSLPVALPT